MLKFSLLKQHKANIKKISYNYKNTNENTLVELDEEADNAKKCSMCNKWFDINDFPTNGTDKKGAIARRQQCKPCFDIKKKSHISRDRDLINAQYDKEKNKK